MVNAPEFYTKTMAKVYADQGYFEKAVEIYRYLLEQEPNRQDLSDDLAEVEENLSAKEKKDLTDLVPLFSQWIELLFSYKKLQILKKLQNQR